MTNLNEQERNELIRLLQAGEPWHYHFYFLSPEDYTGFFDRIRDGKFKGWNSTLMQDLWKQA